uniref:2'-5' RNA ligase family protein n=1 Tax=Arcella intermedia TaxID=1963864 RepID=A0A6B2L6N7_9EUKA
MWEQIQDIRKKHDKAYERWLPHINLLYPFVQSSQFEIASDMMLKALRSITPFQLELNQFGYFANGNTYTIFLKPSHASVRGVLQIQSSLLRLFPFCNELNQKSEKGFQPHLTLAQFNSESEAKSFLQHLKETFQPIQFELNSLHLISRAKNEPFKIQLTFQFPQIIKRVIKTESSYINITDLLYGQQNFPPVEFNLNSKLPQILDNIEKWITNPNHHDSLPKNSKALLTSLLPFTRQRIPILPPSWLLSLLESNQFLTIEPDNTLLPLIQNHADLSKHPLLTTPTSSTRPDGMLDPRACQLEALKKCCWWVIKRKSSLPKDVETLKKALEQLVEVSLSVDGREIIQTLEKKGYIQGDQYGHLHYPILSK